MPSYEPVDLSAACNAGVDVLGDEPGDVPLGRVDLRGLPFLIGPEPPSAERCFLLPGAPVTVGIGRRARRVIVAHRLLEPGAPAGHAVGQAVAEYVFHLAGGEVVTAPIRERFEIQVVPPGWGHLPFLAVTDTNDYNLPRFEGNWGEAGARLAEHAMGWPAGYFLWCWENPHPELAVERIEFIPRGSRFIVAGITTSDVDEHPFVRAPARPVRLVPKDGRERRPRHRRGPGCRDLPAAAARRGRPGRLGSGRGNVRVYVDRRAPVGHRRGPAGRRRARPGALGRLGT